MSTVQDTLDAMRLGNYDRNLPLDCYPEIMMLLAGAKNSRDRQLCYWMLCDIALATRSAEIGTFAVRRLALEKTVKLKVEALHVIMWTSGVTHYDELLTALAQGNSQITYNALKALGACVGTKAETALLETLRAAKEKRDVGNATNAAVSLARMAGADAVGHLATIYPKLPRTTPYGGVLAAVVYAFARHPSASTTALVRRELETTTMGQLGWAALNYLAKWGGADDVPRASRYLTQLLDRYETGVELFSYTMTQVDTKYTTELSASVALLCKDSAAALAPFKPRLRKHWDFFSAHDHAILKEYEPDTFAELQVSAHAVIRTIRTIRTVII